MLRPMVVTSQKGLRFRFRGVSSARAGNGVHPPVPPLRWCRIDRKEYTNSPDCQNIILTVSPNGLKEVVCWLSDLFLGYLGIRALDISNITRQIKKNLD